MISSILSLAKPSGTIFTFKKDNLFIQRFFKIKIMTKNGAFRVCSKFNLGLIDNLGLDECQSLVDESLAHISKWSNLFLLFNYDGEGSFCLWKQRYLLVDPLEGDWRLQRQIVIWSEPFLPSKPSGPFKPSGPSKSSRPSSAAPLQRDWGLETHNIVNTEIVPNQAVP